MPHPVDIHVGKRLRLRRTILGLSQEAVGSAVSVTFQQVQKYERGTNRVAPSRLYEFGKLLSVPVGYFFEGLDTGDPSSADEQLTRREVLELARYYYAIPTAEQRKAAYEMVKALAC